MLAAALTCAVTLLERGGRTIEDTQGGAWVQEAAMRLRPHRRNLVVWRQSASSAGGCGGLRLARTRRIRRRIRVGGLLVVLSLTRLAGPVRGRWRPVLAGAVLTAVGVTMRDGPGGLVLLPGLWFLLTAPLVPAASKADRMRRPELERELALTAFSTPGQRRLASQAMAVHDDRVPGG